MGSEKKISPELRRRATFFARFATATAEWVGNSWVFLAASALIVIWLITGPIYHYSDTWQLVANTATSLITFLVVFLIQNTQNRDARAIHLKLDEIIRSIHHAHNEMIDIEHLSDEELKELSKRYERFRREWEERKDRKKISA